MKLTQLCRTIIEAGHAPSDPHSLEIVADGLVHSAPEVRVAALGAANRLGMLSEDELRRFLADPSIEVRYRAVELVARTPFGPALADELVIIVEQSTEGLAEVAAFGLGELDLPAAIEDRAVEALGHQARNHDDPLCRESAVAALGALGRGLETILAATEDVATVRRRAVLALAPFDGPEVDRALERAAGDRDWQVRQAAEDLAH